MSRICAAWPIITYTASVVCGCISANSVPGSLFMAYSDQAAGWVNLLVDLRDTLLHCLQRVQNACARTILGRAQCKHVAPMLRELHWLPIKSRIQYNVLFYSHVSVCMIWALSTCVTCSTATCSARRLRSAGKFLLRRPVVRSSIGEGALS